MQAEVQNFGGVLAPGQPLWLRTWQQEG